MQGVHPPDTETIESAAESEYVSPVREHRLDRQQKISLTALGAIGVGILIFGFWSLRSGINIPLPTFGDAAKNNTSAETVLADQTLKNQDTDQDGLSDYDEKYVYQTSPYLSDSDSDGYVDKEEVESGHDPNCPAGQNCFSEAFVDDTGATLTAAAQADVAGMTPAELRARLLGTGVVDEETLNQVDDATLMDLYTQTMSSSQEPNAEPSNPLDYTPAQIREMLIENGAEASLVNALDDETLMDLFKEALAEVETMQNENQ
ncbi:MAG: hypothetical protein ACOZBH_01575 [Patescibacteria group bacterium]